MPIAYFDCFAGCGGDMIVASLIDAGACLDAVAEPIARLGFEGVELKAQTVRRRGMRGVHFQVLDHGKPADAHWGGDEAAHEHDHHHRHAHRGLSDVLSLIDRAGLPDRPAERARAIFRRLARAEAKVHGVGVDDVHFHEVGAVDSIVDVVAACVALELLGIERVLCSPITLGSGTIECAHGTMPVPAPATAELVGGAATVVGGVEGEATTPTAAAVLTTLAESFGSLPAMKVAKVGWGAGTRDGGPMPNLLRVFVGEADDAGDVDAAVELSANIDDCTGEVLGATIDKLLLAGCLDAWAAPIVMKKSRPAWMISALCDPADEAEAARILLRETTTFGLRRRRCGRIKLDRRIETVETRYGPIRVKIGLLDGREVTAAPEFEDCRRAAETHHASVREAIAEALLSYRRPPAGREQP